MLLGMLKKLFLMKNKMKKKKQTLVLLCSSFSYFGLIVMRCYVYFVRGCYLLFSSSSLPFSLFYWWIVVWAFGLLFICLLFFAPFLYLFWCFSPNVHWYFSDVRVLIFRLRWKFNANVCGYFFWAFLSPRWFGIENLQISNYLFFLL